MNRILSVFLLLLLLGPSFGQFASSEVCADEQECCDPGPGGAVCLQCACCGGRVTVTSTTEFEDLVTEPEPARAVACVQDPPVAPPSDILHVPKLS